MSARCRLPVVGAGAVLLLLCGCMEIAAFRTTSVRNMANGHRRWRVDSKGLSLLQVHSVVDTAASTTTGGKSKATRFLPQASPRAGLWVMADSRYGLALRTAHGERASCAATKPRGENILQRITTIATKRLPSLPATTPSSSPASPPPRPPPQHPSTSPDSPHLSRLPSNPIERFSGNRKPGIKKSAFMSRITPSGSLASAGIAEVVAVMPSMPSVAGRLISDLRSRSFLPSSSGYQQQIGRASSRSLQEQEHQSRGLRELSSAITRVESKLRLVDSSEASQLREALKTLRSERDAYLRERASNLSRMEGVSREYDEMRRTVATMEAELGRRKGLLKSADVEREEVQQKLSVTVKQLTSGFRKEKERFSRETEAAEVLQGERGLVAAATAKHERDRGYRERLRTLSDGLASTQLQLSTLKSDQEKQKREAARAREDLMVQVARLEAQLKRAGEGVEKERADMETVMLNLSNALSGVDVQLKQSAGMTPNREASRALRRAQEDFRRDQRRVKLLLEKQRQRYDTASSVVEEEAQRLKARTSELACLKIELVESENKEKLLKSKVGVLGSKVSTLDKELRKTREALIREQGLRRQAKAALLRSEKQREEETKKLWVELKATHDAATTTRHVYEGTVKQRGEWRKAVEEKERGEKEAAERADAAQAALQDEVEKNKRSAERRGRELADLKKQVVQASRSLAACQAERSTETTRLREKIDQLKQEVARLAAQTEDSRNLTARTVTGVTRRAFNNASQVSRALAPQGFLSKLGESVNARFRSRGAKSLDTTSAPGTRGRDSASRSTGGTDGGEPLRGRRSSAPDKSREGVPGGRREVHQATAAAGASSSSAPPFSLSPFSPSALGSRPPLAERAVKGVLGRVFPSTAGRNETLRDGGSGVISEVGGPAAEPETSKSSGLVSSDDAVAKEPARAGVLRTVGEKGRDAAKKLIKPRRQPESRLVDATTAAEVKGGSSGSSGSDDSSSNVLTRFGRPDQGSGKPKSPLPSNTPKKHGGAANASGARKAEEAAQVKDPRGGGKTDARQGFLSSVAAARAAAPAPAVPSPAAKNAPAPPVAGPHVKQPPASARVAAASPDPTTGEAHENLSPAAAATGILGKLRGRKQLPPSDAAPDTTAADRRGGRRPPSRSEAEVEEEELHRPNADVDGRVVKGSTSGVAKKKIRAPWASVVEGRRSQGAEQSVGATGDVDKKSGGGADISQTAKATPSIHAPESSFQGEFGLGGSVVGPMRDAANALDEIGLGG